MAKRSPYILALVCNECLTKLVVCNDLNNTSRYKRQNFHTHIANVHENNIKIKKQCLKTI